MLRRDVLAAFVNAIVSVPDGLASAALAGVNPVYGLYTSIAAPIAGSSLASGQLMQIATTSASALAAGQVIAAYPADRRDAALFLLVVLAGVWLGLFGVLRLGRLVRFVSHAVMTGFLAGVAVVLVLDQSAPLVGFRPAGANEVVQFVDLLSHAGQFSGTTTLAGGAALALAIGLARTRFASVASVVALIVPSMAAALLGWHLQRVADVSSIAGGLPMPAWPDLRLLTAPLAGSAFSLAVIIAVQGAGVSQSVENPDDTPVDPSRDLIAQAAANVASGLLSGIPAGGSVGQTALNVDVGARSRWSGIFAGVWMLVIVLAAPDLVGQVPMSVLAALMILAGVSALDLREARSIWRTGGAARVAIAVTFVATLVLSIPLAVATGVILTIVLYLFAAASDVRVRALVVLDGGRFAETDPPARLASRSVTALNVYGSLFFAGARTLAEHLPDPHDAEHAAVVLRLRGRTSVGATLIDVLGDYADELADAGGRLFLTGVSRKVAAQLEHSGKFDLDHTVRIVAAGEILGASTGEALRLAHAWLASVAADATNHR